MEKRLATGGIGPGYFNKLFWQVCSPIIDVAEFEPFPSPIDNPHGFYRELLDFIGNILLHTDMGIDIQKLIDRDPDTIMRLIGIFDGIRQCLNDEAKTPSVDLNLPPEADIATNIGPCRTINDALDTEATRYTLPMTRLQERPIPVAPNVTVYSSQGKSPPRIAYPCADFVQNMTQKKVHFNFQPSTSTTIANHYRMIRDEMDRQNSTKRIFNRRLKREASASPVLREGLSAVLKKRHDFIESRRKRVTLLNRTRTEKLATFQHRKACIDATRQEMADNMAAEAKKAKAEDQARRVLTESCRRTEADVSRRLNQLAIKSTIVTGRKPHLQTRIQMGDFFN